MTSRARSPRPYAALGRRIATLRRTLRLSQRALSKQLDLSESYFSQIESGRSLPSPFELRRIAEHLGGDVFELGALAGYLPEQSEDVRVMGQGERAAIVRQLLALPLERLRALVEIHRISFGSGDTADQVARDKRETVREDAEPDEIPPHADGTAHG